MRESEELSFLYVLHTYLLHPRMRPSGEFSCRPRARPQAETLDTVNCTLIGIANPALQVALGGEVIFMRAPVGFAWSTADEIKGGRENNLSPRGYLQGWQGSDSMDDGMVRSFPLHRPVGALIPPPSPA